MFTRVIYTSENLRSPPCFLSQNGHTHTQTPTTQNITIMRSKDLQSHSWRILFSFFPTRCFVTCIFACDVWRMFCSSSYAHSMPMFCTCCTHHKYQQQITWLITWLIAIIGFVENKNDCYLAWWFCFWWTCFNLPVIAFAYPFFIRFHQFSSFSL